MWQDKNVKKRCLEEEKIEEELETVERKAIREKKNRNN